MTAAPKYRRLPGVRWNPFRKNTLWLAGDHLLAVDSFRFTESYRRYYLKDIQAIILQRKTRVSAGSWAVHITASLVLGLILFSSTENLPLTISLTLLLVGLLVLRSFRNPKCVCQVITAVSYDGLPSLHRLKTAEKALRIIQPLIEEAQKETAPAEQVT